LRKWKNCILGRRHLSIADDGITGADQIAPFSSLTFSWHRDAEVTITMGEKTTVSKYLQDQLFQGTVTGRRPSQRDKSRVPTSFLSLSIYVEQQGEQGADDRVRLERICLSSQSFSALTPILSCLAACSGCGRLVVLLSSSFVCRHKRFVRSASKQDVGMSRVIIIVGKCTITSFQSIRNFDA
jgi:hypothetical protein